MTSSPSVSWQRNWLFILFLFAATFLAYLPAWHGGFLWKDDIYILHDPRLNFFQGLCQIWFQPAMQYYPLTFTTFWIEYHFWGLNTLGYHLVNIFLHALNAVLLWILLRRLSVPGAWLAAGIFALHPVNVESVAWIVERKNTLSGVFYLTSIMAALKFWLPELGATPATPATPGSAPAPLANWKYYWLAFVLFVCAIFSKTTTIPLPAVVLLIVWWNRGKITWRDISPFFLFLAAGIAMGLITRHVEHNLGATGKEFQFSIADRLIVASWNFWFYLGKLLWPHPLIFIYPRWVIDPASPLAWLPLLAIVPVAVILWLSRNSWGRPIFVALAYFAGLMFLMLGFFNIFFFLYSFVSDHFVYLACMGPFALIAAAITLAFNRGKPTGPPGAGQIVFSVGLLALLAMLTWNQCRAYTDAVTLWRDTIAQNPNAFLARNNLGDILLQEGQLGAAIDQYQKSLATHPDALICHNLGNALLSEKNAAGAFSAFQKEVQLQPGSFSGYADLGNFYLQIGRTAAAIQYLQKAFSMKPGDPMVCYNLGNAYAQGRQMDTAIRYWQKAVDLQPDFALAHNNLANAFMFEGHVPQAIQHWERALAVRPDMVSAQVNLAWVLATCPEPALRNGAHALALAQEANQLTGGADPMVLRSLAAAYAENGQFSDAVVVAQQAIQIANMQRNAGLAANIQTQLKFYQSGKPFRETATAVH